jgi:single-stranded-DNA-specific exonuclease
MLAEAFAPPSLPPREFAVDASFSGRRWRMRTRDGDAARAFSRAADVSPLLADLLLGRGISATDVSDYLSPTLKRLLPEPLLLADMYKAVERTRAAIERSEQIAVFGDYDVDGSCSAALLSEYLSAIDHPVRVYIPDRMTEGYGPNAPALLKLKEEGASLVITVDCGAAATAPLSAAREAGLDVIVLDHHTVEAVPPALAHVNPNQPADSSGLNHLCAAGVTFLFVVALNRALRASGWYAANGISEPDLREQADLVALATICDVVPLIGLNRAFVRTGLARLSKLARPGFAALASVAGVTPPCTPYHLGFVFGPRINAGGRVGRCSLGVELLTAKTDAEALARALDVHNKERRAIESSILDDAMAMAAAQIEERILLLDGESWHAGVVGIIAGRVKDRFNKPTFAIGFEGGQGKGSARSVAGFDIGAVVRAAREQNLVEGGGGHAMAAGVSLSRNQVSGFREFLRQHGVAANAHCEAARELLIDAIASPAGSTPALVDDLARLGPFGAGNAEPLLMLSDVRIAFVDVVGRDHVKLQLQGGDGTRLSAIAFRAANAPLGKGLLAARGNPVHVAGHLRAEEWNGARRVELHVEDAAPAAP